MTYTVHVYTARALPRDELTTLITDSHLYPAPTTSDVIVVTRGRRPKHSFTVTTARPVTPDDVPPQVSAQLLEPNYQHELLISEPSEALFAIRFARRLATRAHGGVLDQQTNLVWTRGHLRPAPPTPPGRTTTLDLTWYTRTDTTTSTRAWLDVTRTHLPEALPRRYGTYEPLRHKLDDGGDTTLLQFVSDADAPVHFTGRQPATGGTLPGARHDTTPAVHSLTLLAPPLLETPAWLTAARRLFTTFAASTNAVLATAELTRGARWNGHALTYDATSEVAWRMSTHRGWLGLPAYPVWLTWFGPEYVPLVIDHLDPTQTQHVAGALLHTASPTPQDRDALRDALGGAGLPAELLARADDNLPWQAPTPARTRPATLEHD